MKLWRRLIAETYGTAALAFIIFASSGDPFAVGIGFWVTIVGTGFIGGAHFNPTVTLGAILKELYFTRKLEKNFIREHLFYFLAQIVGAFIGSFAGSVISPDSKFGITIGDNVEYYEAFLAEAAFTGHLVLVVLVTGAVLDSVIAAGMAIAFTVMAGILTVGPISGGCFNPTVCIAINLVKTINNGDSDFLRDTVVYLVGPFIGVAVGVSLAIIFLHERNEINEIKAKESVSHQTDGGLFTTELKKLK